MFSNARIWIFATVSTLVLGNLLLSVDATHNEVPPVCNDVTHAPADCPFPEGTPGNDDFFAEFHFRNSVTSPIPSLANIESLSPVTSWSPTNGHFEVEVNVWDSGSDPRPIPPGSGRIVFNTIDQDSTTNANTVVPVARLEGFSETSGRSERFDSNTIVFRIPGSELLPAPSNDRGIQYAVFFEVVGSANPTPPPGGIFPFLTSAYNAFAEFAFHNDPPEAGSCGGAGNPSSGCSSQLADSLDFLFTPVSINTNVGIETKITVADGQFTGESMPVTVEAKRTNSLYDSIPAIPADCFKADITHELLYMGESPPQESPPSTVSTDESATLTGVALGKEFASIGPISVTPDNNGFYKFRVTSRSSPGMGCGAFAALVQGGFESDLSQTFHVTRNVPDQTQDSSGGFTVQVTVGDAAPVLTVSKFGQASSPISTTDVDLDPGQKIGIQFEVTEDNGLGDIEFVYVRLFGKAATLGGDVAATSTGLNPAVVEAFTIHPTTGAETPLPVDKVEKTNNELKILGLRGLGNDGVFDTKVILKVQFTLPPAVKDFRHVTLGAPGGSLVGVGHESVLDAPHLRVLIEDTESTAGGCADIPGSPLNIRSCARRGFNVNNVAPHVDALGILPTGVFPSPTSTVAQRTVTVTATVSDKNYQKDFKEFGSSIRMTVVDPNTGAVVTTQSVGTPWTGTDQSDTPPLAGGTDGTHSMAAKQFVVGQLAAFGAYPVRLRVEDDGLQGNGVLTGPLSDLEERILQVDAWFSVSGTNNLLVFGGQKADGSGCTDPVLPSPSSAPESHKICTLSPHHLVTNDGSASVSVVKVIVPNEMVCASCTAGGTSTVIPLVVGGVPKFAIFAFVTPSAPIPTTFLGVDSVTGSATVRVGDPLSADGVLLKPGETLKLGVKDVPVPPGTTEGTYSATIDVQAFFKD